MAALLAAARAGVAGALVLRGEPGVGKSALLQDARVAGAGMRVLTAQGLESEAPLAFAGLLQLLRPLLGLVEGLAQPQARALRIAFGMQDGPVAEPFLVALATLNLLSEAADSSPVLCLVDDAHWLDAASADALLFAARRLQADAVALLFAAREGDVRGFAADGIPELTLGGLSAEAARTLLAERAGSPLSDQVTRAVLRQAGGNPLALVELPTSLTEAQLAGAAPVPAQLALTQRVQRVFLDRCRRLPAEVQLLLLVAAADDSGRLSAVTRAAALLGVPAEALPEAERAGLLVTDRDTLRVRHPLVRSGVYQAAAGYERRRVHRALAEVLAGDPDRQSWHRAAAVEGPDAEVAAALRLVADRAERRGGYLAAAAAYERAAELATGPRAETLFAAARNSWASGQVERARALAAAALTADSTTSPDAQTTPDATDSRTLRADLDRLRGRIEIGLGSAAAAYRIFDSAARAVLAADDTRAVELWVAATLTRSFDTETSAGPAAEAVPEQVLRERPGDSARTRCLRLLLAAATADAAGSWDEAMRSLGAAVRASAGVEDADVLANLGNTALHLGDDETHRRCYTRMLAGARDRSAGMVVLYALPRLAFADLLAGDWARVRSAAEEAVTLSADLGQPALGVAPLGWLTLLAALQGAPDYDERRARFDTAAAGRQLGVLTDAVHDLAAWAAGVRAAADGNNAAALRRLGRMRLPALARMAGYDRVEAALRAGDLQQARAWCDEFTGYAATSAQPWAGAAAEHARALLAGPAAAPALFESALSHHRRAGRPYEQARTQLAYGELLRRTQRRSEARSQLRAALAVFEQLGAEPLRARAEQELRATGETARKRDPSTLTLLTPMELQVAQLVARGLSNKEAAAQCWISPRTVAFHLRNVFAKTGVTSRGELAQLGPLRS